MFHSDRVKHQPFNMIRAVISLKWPVLNIFLQTHFNMNIFPICYHNTPTIYILLVITFKYQLKGERT